MTSPRHDTLRTFHQMFRNAQSRWVLPFQPRLPVITTSALLMLDALPMATERSRVSVLRHVACSLHRSAVLTTRNMWISVLCVLPPVGRRLTSRCCSTALVVRLLPFLSLFPYYPLVLFRVVGLCVTSRWTFWYSTSWRPCWFWRHGGHIGFDDTLTLLFVALSSSLQQNKIIGIALLAYVWLVITTVVPSRSSFLFVVFCFFFVTVLKSRFDSAM